MRPSAAAAALSLITIAAGCARHNSRDLPQVVVIGVDGMDAGFVERHWQSLPNLRYLRDAGGYSRLRTTTPPQSPVAWSSFITGLDPQGHGIYDFVHREPSTLAPFSSMDRTEPPRLAVPLGPWRLPLSSARVVSMRHGVPFWRVLSDNGIPVMTIRMPTNYPPVKAGLALAGMGVPDLRGDFGVFTFFTDDPEEITREVAGGRIVRVPLNNGRALLPLDGPPNSLRADRRSAVLEITADVDPKARAVRLRLPGTDAILQQGEWSEWLAAEFPLLGPFASVRGMFRVYAKQLAPRFQLYLSPLNVDPRHPALPIAEPDSFSRDIAREIGPFYTQGIAEDTSALRHGVFSMAEYLAQSRLVFEDERRLLGYALRRFDRGLLFFYFSHVDQNSHVLWGEHEEALLECYRAVDSAIGEAIRALPRAQFLVMSDHGFAPFRRSFQLNAWLVEQGLLALSGPPAGEGFRNVDWGRTTAYGLGLNGLYLNLRGREKAGVVDPARRTAVCEQIRTALLAVRDPQSGLPVVQSVAVLPVSETAPDLIVGYAPGFRASWDTGLGATAGPVFQDNNEPWIADHCMDPAAVPGVLLGNRPLPTPAGPSLTDLAPAILRIFGVALR